MDSWSVEMVETRLEDAAHVIRRLPAVRMPGYFNTWPTMLIEFADRVGRDPEPMRLPPPSSSAITRMEEALEWLRWLEGDDAKLVWARCRRDAVETDLLPLWHCARHGKPTLAVCTRVIAWRLNGRSCPRSVRAHFVERTRAASSAI